MNLFQLIYEEFGSFNKFKNKKIYIVNLKKGIKQLYYETFIDLIIYLNYDVIDYDDNNVYIKKKLS